MVAPHPLTYCLVKAHNQKCTTEVNPAIHTVFGKQSAEISIINPYFLKDL